MLQNQIQGAKSKYSNSLKSLEQISEEIHKKRGQFGSSSMPPVGPREPGVGAELNTFEEGNGDVNRVGVIEATGKTPTTPTNNSDCDSSSIVLPDFNVELDKCEIRSVGTSVTTSSAVSEKDDDESDMEMDDNELDLEELRQKIKVLAIRPVEGGDGQQEQDVWESELNETVNKLDQLMMRRECSTSSTNVGSSLPSTPIKKQTPIKKLKTLDPLPLLNVSMNVLPTIGHHNGFQHNFNSSAGNNSNPTNKQIVTQKRRKLSE